MRITVGLIVVVLAGLKVGSCQEPAFNSAGSVPVCVKPARSTLSDEERVDQIVRKTIEAGRSVLPNGVHVVTFVPISTSDSNEILALGACAIPPLVRILDWQSDFAQLISVRLLAQIGSAETAPALERALAPNRWQPVRMSALYGLAGTRWGPQTMALVQRLTDDQNQRIREIATSILAEKLACNDKSASRQ